MKFMMFFVHNTKIDAVNTFGAEAQTLRGSGGRRVGAAVVTPRPAGDRPAHWMVGPRRRRSRAAWLLPGTPPAPGEREDAAG